MSNSCQSATEAVDHFTIVRSNMCRLLCTVFLVIFLIF